MTNERLFSLINRALVCAATVSGLVVGYFEPVLGLVAFVATFMILKRIVILFIQACIDADARR